MHWHICFCQKCNHFFHIKVVMLLCECFDNFLLYLTLIPLLSYILMISLKNKFQLPFSKEKKTKTAQCMKLLLLSKPCHGGKSALIQVTVIGFLLTTSASLVNWFDLQRELRMCVKVRDKHGLTQFITMCVSMCLS